MFPTQNSWWSSWFSKAASRNTEAYDFIILYQGDFLAYFPECKWFWHPFCFSIIASKILNVHNFLPIKNFWGGGGYYKQNVWNHLYHLNHLNYIVKESMNIPKWWKRHKSFWSRSLVKTANFSEPFTSEITIDGYFLWNVCTHFQKICS